MEPITDIVYLCMMLMCCPITLADTGNETSSINTTVEEPCVGACAWAGYDWSQRNGSKISNSKKYKEPSYDYNCGGIGEVPCGWYK